MKVRFSKEKPPIYEECVKRFGVNWKKGIIFTYGDTIHCRFKPHKWKVEHEKVHIRQQEEVGPEAWWNRYFEDEAFRVDQEVEAYRAEIGWLSMYERNIKRRLELIERAVRDLSGPIYGNVLTYDQAKFLLLNKEA